MSSLWHLIGRLEARMPLTVTSAQEALDMPLVAEANEGAYAHFQALAIPNVLEGRVRAVRLMLKSPALRFVGHSALTLEVDGSCLTLSDVRRQVGELALIQPARGRSLDEFEVWRAARPWGALTFGFVQRQPDCLARVGFHRQLN